MKRKTKRWCVWVRWMDDGPPRRQWGDFELLATFQAGCGREFAREYRKLYWTAHGQTRVLPEGQHPKAGK